jgi:hypothetical protein
MPAAVPVQAVMLLGGQLVVNNYARMLERNQMLSNVYPTTYDALPV